MKNYFLFFLILLFVSIGNMWAQAPKEKDKAAVMKILKTQEAAWNSGDLEGFMDGYVESEALMFVGSKGITYGWQPTLDRYKKGYPDQKTMGKLTFTILEMNALGKKHMLVVGKWHLGREEMEDAEGHFTLTWGKTKAGWKILADHSS